MPANLTMNSITEPPDANQEPSLTRWSFQDFENAYEAKFSSQRINLKDGHEGPQKGNASEANGAIPKEVGSNKELNRPHIDKTVYSSGAIYEQRLKKKNGSQSSNGVSNGVSNGHSTNYGLPKPLPEFASEEMRELADGIRRDIVTDTTDVGWNTIKGLESAKRILKEAVVMPIKYPQYFTGLLTPWKGILLFGPPGTGKTMLAKAVASECNTTFFNISASSIISKWRGDSEKLVRVLFELAHYYAPSTIFMDEIDAIISQRGENRSEHEASRRLKTELLVQMDGLAKSEHLIFLLAATNIPWELDAAMLRRLEKRILVPLPEPAAREAMFKSLLPSTSTSELPYDLMVESTEGYSGSDIRIVCKEAAMRPLRRLISELEDLEATEAGKEETTSKEKPTLGAILEEDVRASLKITRPSAHMIAARYEQFDADFGSHTVS